MTTPHSWKETFEVNGASAPHLVLHFNRRWLWFAWLCLFVHVLNVVLLYLANPFGWMGWTPNNVFMLGSALVYGISGMALAWILNFPLLTLNEDGISTLLRHLTWEKISLIEAHWSCGVSGIPRLNAITFKNFNGQKLHSVQVGFAPARERDELLRQIKEMRTEHIPIGSQV